ncbi:hypothetical protein SAMN05192557_0235 [Aliicoccus persicus]|uniref:Uncharacterized protein n=1 Tax=Aliicoccus persicus TaxID=930138 RepID=A0A662Z0U0_9STAP|nr:hypothetical protein SAMN05192557_0235 [Aliicoccus persicus]
MKLDNFDMYKLARILIVCGVIAFVGGILFLVFA